jgi:hypothetical protein
LWAGKHDIASWYLLVLLGSGGDGSEEDFSGEAFARMLVQTKIGHLAQKSRSREMG